MHNQLDLNVDLRKRKLPSGDDGPAEAETSEADLKETTRFSQNAKFGLKSSRIHQYEKNNPGHEIYIDEHSSSGVGRNE